MTSGPYRWVRHPLYLGLFLIGVSMSALMANAPGLALTGALVAWAIARRVREEEGAMECVLGGRYRTWARARRRFLPFLA